MPPAARVADPHLCPMVTGIVPHVGGPILPPGCPTVLIGMMPAARVGDMLTCVGPPDVIAKGSPTVLIGNMMAARMGDMTAHGGSIVFGFPTVMIGEQGQGAAGGSAAPSTEGAGSQGTAGPPPLAEAQIQALTNASNSGVAFCEQCSGASADDSTPSESDEAQPEESDDPPPQPGPTPPGGKHKLEFHFKTDTAKPEPIDDPAGFVLTHPDGKTEDGKLADGGLERSGVKPGTYRMQFKYIHDAAWSTKMTHAEQTVGLKVKTHGLKDGEKVKFKVFEKYQYLKETPLAELEGTVHDNHATAHWTYKQQVGKPPDGEFIFMATWQNKLAEAPRLKVVAYSLEDMRGIQQKLKLLACDPGKIDGLLGPKTAAAVKKFQAKHPPLAVDGIPGPLTQRELDWA